ncbi:MAG: penicillin-binding protein activator [Gammaproteobacteria bacterium]
MSIRYPAAATLRTLGLGALIAILAIAGCQSTPGPEPAPAETPTPDTTAPAPVAERADGLSPTAAAARASLDRAEALLTDDDAVGATAEFSLVKRADLPRADRGRYALLGSALARKAGDLAAARQYLDGAGRAADPLDQALISASQLQLAQDPVGAAIALIGFSSTQDAAAAGLVRLHDAIWAAMSEAPPLAADALARAPEPIEQGWWQLRVTVLRSVDAADAVARIQRWRASHPEHPAARRLPTPLTRAPGPGPRHIGLFIPETGPLARAGRAVRDGLLAAWLQEAEGKRPVISVYDTGSAPLPELYQRARTEGVDLIIGPLEREQIAALDALGPDRPVLALNNLGAAPASPSLHQFGLAPEDEMASLAAWLRALGAERVLVLRGPHDWALRLERALAGHGFTAVGSYLIPELRTVTDTVGTALQIEASKTRHAEIQRLTGLPLGYIPRARGDVDAIVTLVDALEITGLVPALRFHYADRIPAFAPAQTLRGSNPGTLQAMAGFRVVELPWSLPDDEGRLSLGPLLPSATDPFAIMYAFGADALRMGDRVWRGVRGPESQTLGLTGALQIGPDGRVQRDLARMTVARGQLSPAPAVEETTSADAQRRAP